MMVDPEEEPGSGSPENEAADAEWVVRQEAEKPPSRVPPSVGPVSSDESYDIVGGDEPEPEPVPPVAMPTAPDPAVRPPAPKPEKSRTRSARARAAEARVDQVWSRGAEWGADLIRVGAAAGAILFLLYLAVGGGHFLLALLVLMAGAVGLGVLGYPIFISLERPVRIVPEQAVKDYYGALSHAVPHYRRMWLLLSSEGRASTHFTTFESFRAYWNEKRAALGGGRASLFDPLHFAIEEFHSEKNADQTGAEVKFRLVVHLESNPSSPLATYPMEIGLVKGPDRMWYLNAGTLPGGRAEAGPGEDA